MQYKIFGENMPAVTMTLDAGESIYTQSGGYQGIGFAIPAATARDVASAGSRPRFTSLFQVGDRAEAISPMVQSLWATGRDIESASPAVTPPSVATATAAPTAQPMEPTFRRPTPLDLFSDRKGVFAG